MESGLITPPALIGTGPLMGVTSRNRLFTPATRGTDHANKEYFFSLIDTGLHQHITDTYISLATGQPCRTVATRLEHASGASFVLCMDQRLKP